MKYSIALCAVAAFAISGCKSEVPEAAPTGQASAEAAPAAPAAAAEAAAPGAAPTKDFVVGKWGDNGDCQLAIEFKADGSMVGPFDKWELDDKGVLTMVGNPQKMHLTVVDQDNMESRLGGTGEPRRINRCK